jgi:drug/metabolite transporter (DMT)-like permease
MRPLLLVLASMACGLTALYLFRGALLEVGGFRLTTPTALQQLGRLLTEWRFWAGVVLLIGVMLISLDLWNEELSKVVPLYSLSYVVIALIGQLFLDEHVALERWLGILAIVAGVVLLQRS